MQEYIYLFISSFLINYLIMYLNKDKIDFSLEYSELEEKFITHLKTIDFIHLEEKVTEEELNRIKKIIDTILEKNNLEISIKDYLLKENFNKQIIVNIILKEIIPDLSNLLSLLYSKISNEKLENILFLDDKYINKFSNKIINDINIENIFENINFLELLNNIKNYRFV
ncbi:MAG: hypothetical protein KatS3mg068_0709 [Candidatus Sericytochromatia bacterium]|nr:MAG: hypothetical protein KatS3mg068_0709 [Candidatus Sericytochromatia bacterium]